MRSISPLRLAAIVILLLLLSATTVFGGSGVGGVFNLGVQNTVNKVTALKGTASTGMLRVTNDGSGPALDLRVKNSGTSPILLDAESTGRVQYLNADRLDGFDSSQLVHGKGVVTRNAIALGAGDISPVLVGGASDSDIYWGIGYVCPATLTQNGSYRFLANPGNGNVNLFIDQGLADPEFLSWPSGVELTRPTNAAGEWVHIQVQSGLGWIADIDMFSVHRASDCHVQGVAITTLP